MLNLRSVLIEWSVSVCLWERLSTSTTNFFYIFCLCYSVFLTSLSRLSLQVSAVCLAFLLFFISFDTVFIFSCFTALFSLYSLSLARNKQKINSSQKKSNWNVMINSCFRFRCAIVQAVTSSSSGLPSFCFPSTLSCKFLRPAAPSTTCQKKCCPVQIILCLSFWPTFQQRLSVTYTWHFFLFFVRDRSRIRMCGLLNEKSVRFLIFYRDKETTKHLMVLTPRLYDGVKCKKSRFSSM